MIKEEYIKPIPKHILKKLEIIDYTGKVVQTEENITQNISVKSLATGTYILRLSTNKKATIHKLM